MGKKKRNRQGVCKLTGQSGAFVDSHIIPEALSRPSVSGNPLFQYAEGQRPIRRWTSWYDRQLVTAEGEQYLSEIDTWGIAKLRETRLVWSGWGTDTRLRDHTPPFGSSIGVRAVEVKDSGKLRLFFHSLLWRAAASGLNEFKDIRVNNSDLDRLRREVVGLESPPLDFYPVQLTQLSTKGPMHNQTPVPDIKYLPRLGSPESPPHEVPMFRFYLDGLIAHVYRTLPDGYDLSEFGEIIVGAGPSVVLVTVTFEESFQFLNMKKFVVPN